MKLELLINGTRRQVEVEPRMTLVDCLRERLDLTGVHTGCEHGICGACTVLIDGEPARSCITLAAQASGSEVVTVEGLTPDDGLSDMQRAFHEHHALQCGFCTAGLLVTLEAADPAEHPDDDSIRELLSGNICRCTGYDHIVAAVRAAWGRG